MNRLKKFVVCLIAVPVFWLCLAMIAVLILALPLVALIMPDAINIDNKEED